MTKDGGTLDKDLIRELAELLEETGLTEIEIELEGRRFRVARLAVSTAYDEKLRQPLCITDVLPATTPDLFVHFEWADAPRGAPLGMQVWREGRRLPEFDAEVELRENVRGVARSRLHRRGGFEPGQYEARFLSGTEVIGYRRFVVER